MNTAPKKWVDPPLFIASTATFLACLIAAFALTYAVLNSRYGPLPFPQFPIPWGSYFPGSQSSPTPANAATQTETVLPTLTTIPTSTPTATLPVDTSTPTITPTFTLTPTQTATPTPVPTATRPPLPPAARVNNIVGHSMISSLDCEARAAVDWAGFFGVPIDEPDFLNKMPFSDNPEKGFVGHWWDRAGSIPPNSYGIHAAPIAEELRKYGLKAVSRKGITFYDLQEQIAAGRPAMVWVIGPVQPVKNGVEYTAASDGEKTIVAPFEHTVLLIGYDQNSVTILDGAYVYTRPINHFLISWGTLGNMAVTYFE